MARRLSEFGFGGDAYPASQPQYQNDHPHDDPIPQSSAGYKFFYGNGQLHVSPHHTADDLRQHAQVSEDHTGPMAVGEVSVDQGRATWHVEGNVAVRGLFKVLKEYTSDVGWRWGGMTDIEGQPFDDDFAPRKAMKLRDNETAQMRSFVLQGKTAHVDNQFTDEMREALREAGYKIAEVPGGGNFMDKLKRQPDLQEYNHYSEGPIEKSEVDDQPTGTFKCPRCGQVSPNWSDYMAHRAAEDEDYRDIEPVEDGRFPPLPDMDKAIPPNFVDRQPRVMPLASVNDARRYAGYDESRFVWDTSGLRYYGAFDRGSLVGVASVDGRGTLRYVGGRTQRISEALVRAIAVHFPSLRSASSFPGSVPSVGGYRYAAGQQPKDMIDGPIPFVYDVLKDQVVVGPVGTRHSDIPVEWTPGGIVEGTYEPGGKVTLHTMTNVPYTKRHLLDLWYWQYPHMEVTSLEQIDRDGKPRKLARRSAVDVGQYVKQLAVTDPAVWNSYQALRNAGGSVYVVGGAIRDALMQKEPKDIDLLVSGLPSEEVNHVLEQLPGRVDLTGKSFGVYRYNVKGNEVEIALPRTERSTGDRRVDFDVSVDHQLPIETDLLRRDFTINAMAVSLDTGELVDPYGGAQAIENHHLKTTHPSSFREDPTRLLRALVFNGRYGFHPDETTRQEMTQHADRLPFESADAKQPILEKLLSSTDPARAIRLAHETGLLKHVFPEVETHWDYDQANPHHSYPLGEHLVNVLHNVSQQSSDPDLRLAALLHDIGKPASRWTDDSGVGHYYRSPDGLGADHEHTGAEMAEFRLRALRWPVARTKRIHHLITHHMFPAFSGEKGARKFLHRVGDEHADDLLTLRWADHHGKGQSESELAARTSVDTQRAIVEQVRSKQDATTQSALNINGNDILALGVKPGPQVGQVLRQLTDDVVDDPSLNERDLLLQRAQEYINAIA